MRFKSIILPALGAVASLVLSTVGASAYVVCNREGDCWHTESRYHYPGVGFTFHPDDWYFHQTWGSDRHFREYNRGRGYWKGGVWVTF
ncbi:MAG: hypothetical protein JO256_06815 [Alphaproteobacteria bacterium]|nr:hypothetical protein [Alphaproteobacteria bacterium]